MKITLEELEQKDLPIICDWIDPNIFQIFQAPVDEEQLERLLSKRHNGLLMEQGLRGVDTKTGEILGLIHIVIDHKNDLAHVQQIVVDPNLRGKGIGTAILKMLLEICFVKHQLHRVQIFVDEDSKQAISCYKKAGFKTEGLMREAAKVKNSYLSWYSMSVLANEWKSDKS